MREIDVQIGNSGPNAQALQREVSMNQMRRILPFVFVVLMLGGCGGGGPLLLSLSQSDLMFSAPFGGQNPAAEAVNVSVSGADMTSFIAASDSPWLSVTPGNGTAPNAIQVTATLGTLTTANYTGHITVTAPGVQGSPATITVTFNVGGATSVEHALLGTVGSESATHRHGRRRGAELDDEACRYRLRPVH